MIKDTQDTASCPVGRTRFHSLLKPAVLVAFPAVGAIAGAFWGDVVYGLGLGALIGILLAGGG